jgi:hypothetical protein
MANVLHKTTLEFRGSVNGPDYDPAVWLINPPGLTALLESGVPSKNWKIVNDTDVTSFTTQEIEDRDFPISKEDKFAAIDARTDALCSLGFEFPAQSGQRFSLSPMSQLKLLGLDSLRNDVNLVYPIAYNTIDDNDLFSITDATMMHIFFLTAVGTYRAVIDAGTNLKTSVRAATTVAEVNAVQDTR